MAIKDKLTQLNTTKQGIKEVLQEKGVELAGKTFSDTPALIGQMSVGKGDEVEAFALGEAKHARVGDKVILNYAADMLPGEASIKNIPSSLYSDLYGLTYADRKSLYFGYLASYANIGYFSRNEDWTYDYYNASRVNFSNYSVRDCIVLPYGLVGVSNEDKCYLLNGLAVTSYSTYGGFKNEMAGTQSRDYKYATFGTRLSSSDANRTYIFELNNGSYSLFAKARIEAIRTSVGVLMDNGVYKLVVIRDTTVETYSLGKDGTTALLGTTQHTMGVGDQVNMWRPIGNRHVIARIGTSTGNISGIFGFSYSFENGLCTVVKDNILTNLLQQEISRLQLSTVNNIIVDNHSFYNNYSVYMWGKEGLSCFNYNEVEGKITHIDTPFPDIPWNPQFFINPVDKVAIQCQSSITDVCVRYLDAPIVQKYVATKAADGLQFQSVSLIGYVKENKGDVLTVETLTDPNGVIPSYRVTLGLNVTVNAGHEESDSAIWTRPNLTSATSYGNVSDSRNNSSEAGWKALDGSLSSNFVPATAAGWWQWELPVTLKFTANESVITWVHRNNSETMSTANCLQFFADREMTKPLTAPFSDPSSSNVSVDLPVVYSGPTHMIYLKIDAHSGYGGAAEIQFTHVQSFEPLDGGTIDISWGWFKSGNDYVKWSGTPPATLANIEGNKATKMSLWLVKDGDAAKPVISTLEPTSYTARHKVDDVYLSDTLDYFLPKPYGLTSTIDYGHMPEVRVKPIVLSANGTIGTDEFAVSASDQYSSAYAPYICFSTSSYEAWISNASASVANPLYYTIYSKKPLNIRHITMKNRPSNIGEMLGDFVWQASTDGTQWVDLATFENRDQTAGGLVEFDMDDTHYYSYYRFKITSAATGNSGRVSIGKLTLSTFEDFFAGAVTVDDGMAYVDETSYRLTQSLTKSFEDVIVGDKAQEMFIWMIKKAAQTDFVVSATAPKDVDSCYKLGATPVYLSTDLTYFRDESSSS